MGQARAPYLRIALLAGLACLAAGAARAGEFLVRSNPARYRVTVDYAVNIRGSLPRRTVVILPLPQRCEAQDIVQDVTSPGDVLTFRETGDRYLRVVLYNKLINRGKPEPVRYSFDAVLYDVQANLELAETQHPYLESTANYRLFTRKSGEYVDPGNPEIAAAAGRLGKEARNDDVEFARLAYAHVIENYSLHGESRKLRTLDKILAQKGGTAGELNSIFVSLLRRRGIPARHVAGFRIDGSPKVMAEFYLEHRGWVPVDIVAGIRKPGWEHFGAVRGGERMFVVARGVGLTVENWSDEEETLGLFQTYSYWSELEFTRGRDGRYLLRNPIDPKHSFSVTAVAAD